MRRVLALALGLCLWAAPVLAAITQVTGTGTGGAISDLAFNAGTSLAMTPTAAMNAGSLGVVIMNAAIASGTSTGFSCTDSGTGNTWTAAPNAGFNSNANVQILYSYLAGTIANGGTVTCTEISGPSGIVGQILAFSGTATNPYNQSAATGLTGTGTAISAGPTPTLACPGGGASCEVCVGGSVWASGGTVTNDATFTTTGNNSQVSNGFKIVSENTGVTFAPSNSVSAAYGATLACFNIPSPSAPNNLSTLGVGH